MRRRDAGMAPSTCWQRCRALLLLYQSLVPTLATSMASRFLPKTPAEIGAKWAFRELRQDGDKHLRHRRQASFCDGGSGSMSSDVGECILLFGAFHKANMGDAAQLLAVEHLLALAAPPDQCFWYAHPWGEYGSERETHTAELSNGPASCSIPLTVDYAKEVNRFKALVIGGGKVPSAKLKHAPLNVDSFFEHITLPVIILGVGTSYKGGQYSSLLRKASFLSGRDVSSTKVFATVLHGDDESLTRPDNVALVRDPVLSDRTLTDTGGTCWKQSEGEHEQQLCFVLPVPSQHRNVMHRNLVDRIVGAGDVFVNISPKHQKEVEDLHYPGEVLQLVDPKTFADRLCSCRAIISTDLHGAIFGLHMGVPTLGAFRKSKRSDVRDLMIDTMDLPEQFFVIDEHLTREAVDAQVQAVRESYAYHNRRASVHARLSAFSEDFQHHAQHVLFDVIGVKQQREKQEQQQKQQQNEHQHQQREQQQRQQQQQKQADVVLVKAEVVTEKLPKDSEEVSVEKENPSVSTALSSAAEAKGESTKVDSATDQNLTTGIAVNQESPSLAAVLLANKAAFKRPWDTIAEPVKWDIPVGWRGSGPHDIKVISAAHHTVISDKERSNVAPARHPEKVSLQGRTGSTKAPLAGDNTSAEIPDAVVQKKNKGPTEASAVPHRSSEPVEAASAFKASSSLPEVEGANTTEELPTQMRGSSSGILHTAEGVSMIKLVSNDYFIALLLIAAITWLAVLPSGIINGKSSCDKAVGVQGVHLGRGHLTSRSKRDDSKPRMCAEQVTACPMRSAGACARATIRSSKIAFMLNFTMWVSLSMGFSGYGRAYLSDTHDPVGLLVLQGAGGVALLCSLGRLGVLDQQPLKDLVPVVARQAGPAALLYTCQALVANFTVCVRQAVVTNAMKATEPFAAAVLSYLVIGENAPFARMATLPVIVGGTVLMVLESNEDGGLNGSGGGYPQTSTVLAMAAVCSYALRNVVIKKGKPISAHKTLLACSVAATVVGIGLMLLTLVCRGIRDFFEEAGAGNSNEHGGGGGGAVGTDRQISAIWPRMEGVNAALCFIGYNLASFNLLLRLSPVSHAVGNACKRMIVFASGLLFVGEVMTIGQLGGMAVALIGVLMYNFAGTGVKRLLR